MMGKRFLFIKRTLLVASAIFFVNSIVFARGYGMGKLLLSGGQNQLFEIGFDGGNIAELAKIPDHGNYRANYLNLEKVDDNRFLFETPSHKVGLYSVGSLQEEILFDNSSCPTYFEGSSEVLFSKVEKTDSGFEEHLYLSGLDGANPVALKKLARGSASKCPIKLNGDEALIFLSYGTNKELSIFNVKDRTFSEKIGLCEPVFGLSDRKLLCFSDDSYFISDYEGKKLKNIGSDLLNKNNMFPVATLTETNSILVQEYRERLFRSTVVNLWILDLSTLKKRLIVKDFGVDQKGAVYLNR